MLNQVALATDQSGWTSMMPGKASSARGKISRRIGVAIAAMAVALAWPMDARAAGTVLSSMQQMSQARTELVQAIIKGETTPAVVLLKLKATRGMSGLNVDADTDLGYGAQDLAYRLYAAGKFTEAKFFFSVAETSLAVSVQKTSDSEVDRKAMLLQNLAQIRGRFLGEQVQAEADITAARKLRPDDAQLKNVERMIKPQVDAAPTAKDGTPRS